MKLPGIDPRLLSLTYGVDPAALAQAAHTQRRLSDLADAFADPDAYRAALAESDPVVYDVYGVAPADGDGDLHYGLGVLYPGRVGAEYFLTKGHFHAWRPAAEVYVGLRGSGRMLLEDETTDAAQLVDLSAGRIVYVPGHTAHRTMNVGGEPLVYLGIYPARAGHDYGVIAERNFRHVLVAGADGPRLIERTTFLRSAT